MTSPVPHMLTVNEVAERLHVHPQTVRLWIRQKKLGRHKFGAKSLISDDQYLEFVRAHRQDDGDD